jgi:hypothetical protein
MLVEKAPKMIRAILTFTLLYFSVTQIISLLTAAYDIRMHAIRTYGYIIHEVGTVVAITRYYLLPLDELTPSRFFSNFFH